jgi:hypothetical protein
MDDLHIGVRSTSVEVDQVLRAALAAHHVEGLDAPPNYSVQIGGSNGAASGFHFLYRSSTSVIRTRDPHRVVRGLFTHLSSHTDGQPGTLRVQGVTLVAGDVALLAPPVLRQWPDRLERRLNGRGLRVADTPWAHVDPERAEVVIPEPALDIDWSALDTIDRVVAGPRREDPPVPPGRYPRRGWAFPVAAEHTGRLSRAHAVTLATQLVIGLEPGTMQRALDDLAAVLRVVDATGLTWRDPTEAVGPLAAMV